MLAGAGVLLLVAVAAIGFALQVTPDQTVTALGQTVAVGAAAPMLGTSGPGEVVLFGQTLPTQIDFVGPVRPRLVLTNIDINEQVAEVFAPGAGTRSVGVVGEALADGFRRYFGWEIAFVALGAVVLLGAVAGWRRSEAKGTLITVLGGLVVVEAVNLGVIMVTAYSAPDTLRRVGSVSALVGRAPRRPLPAAAGPAAADVQAIVLGDSTAAGLGGPPVPEATPNDEACRRSSFAFAGTLAAVNAWTVENLACGGATIDEGILGAQTIEDRRIPAQLAVAKRATNADLIIVNVGANDLRWSTFVFLCGASPSCDDRALTAFFQRSLDAFTQSYYELLRQLAVLPNDPLVLINQYYVPFDPALDCLQDEGLTRAKLGVLLDRLDALNTVLAGGAETFGYRTTRPDYAGHELCTDQPYVQGPDDEAPLHPNARGQLVIALADERVLLEAA